MPSFAEIKARATKAKDASVEKIQQTRDRNTSVPMAKTNWDPYSGQPAPPPPAPRVNARNRPAPKTFPPPPPAFNRPPVATSSPSSPSPPTRRSPALSPSPAPPLPSRSPAQSPPLPSRSSVPPALPTRAAAGPPPIVRSTRPDLPLAQEPEIDWANLSPQDKDVFFSWLDEFFGNYLNITISPKLY